VIFARNQSNDIYQTCEFDSDDYRYKSIEFLLGTLTGPFVVEFEYDQNNDVNRLVEFFSNTTKTVDYFIYEIMSQTGEVLDSKSWVAENFTNIDKLAQHVDLRVYTSEKGFRKKSNYPINYCDTYLWWEFSNTYDLKINKQSISKKFLLLNGKDKPSRKLITSYVAGTALQDSVISYREPIESTKTKNEYVKVYGDYKKQTKSGLSHLQQPNDLLAPVNTLMQNVFCRIVTETNFERPYQNFSEKTVDTIRLGKPFVLVAPYRTLTLLKELGFKTFDKWWDESYDTQINPEKRLRKIIKVIDKISDLSYTELNQMYEDMQPVLEHNLTNLNNCADKFYNYYKEGQL
jgi:hypothetical protein